MPGTIFTFDTTHHALWAEELAAEHRIPVEVVPAPAEANAKCSLALETLADQVTRLEQMLKLEGVPFGTYPG